MRWSRADLKDALEIAKDSGYRVVGFEITPRGTIRVMTEAERRARVSASVGAADYTTQADAGAPEVVGTTPNEAVLEGSLAAPDVSRTGARRPTAETPSEQPARDRRRSPRLPIFQARR